MRKRHWDEEVRWFVEQGQFYLDNNYIREAEDCMRKARNFAKLDGYALTKTSYRFIQKDKNKGE